MFSFRELVESMEKKTSEIVAPISRPTQLSLPRFFHDALIDCEESAREQTSQHTAETNNEKMDGHGRQEGFFEHSDSRKELEHHEVTFWEEKVVHPSRDDQTACTEKTDIESLWIVRKETDVLPIFKHGSLIMKPENDSVNDFYDAVKRNDCTLPQLNLVHQISSLDEQDLNASNTSLRPEHHLTCSSLDSKGKRKHNSDEDIMTPASQRLSEDTDIQGDKCNQLKTNRTTTRRMCARYKIRDRVCRSAKQKYSHNPSEEIRRGEEVSNVSSTAVRKQGGEDIVENYASADLLLHESQCAEMCHHQTPVKETLVSNDQPERDKTAAQGSWSSDLHYFITDPWQNATVATMPRLNNQNCYSEQHRNTSGKSLRINEENEWAALSLPEYEEEETTENSRHASKHDEKDPDKIRGASRGSQSMLHAPTSGTSESIARTIATHFARNSREKLRNLRKKKDSKEISVELIKDLPDYNVHERKRNRSRDPQSLAPAVHDVDTNMGDNDGSRASSSSTGFRCQLCLSWWRDEISLARHQRLHAPGRPFACPDCPSRFNQLVHLQIHRRTHTGDKPFRCGTCSASFSRKDRLRSHERRHSGEQPYTCPYCPASFRDAGSLRGHVLAHAHQPPYTCRLCSATFAHLSTFTSHWRLHK
ncbi:hypothetical protein O3P69_007464 [Scylla paramamosain]|uniref:C2H2-type domain-containing protein n=1 Tax=Scylla paramamosain TaxID=85552 RepID=A0AAW0V3L5_SCYPA